MEFVGRERELEFLEKLYARGSARCMIYGRRRIGKSRLIERFCEGKPAMFFHCAKGTAESKLEYMTDVINGFTSKDSETPNSFYNLFKMLGDACPSSGAVVVFDEYPYLIEDDDALPTEVQRFIDVMLSGKDTMVIMCGSSISVMEEEFNNSSKPLYGRFKHRLMLGPLNYNECVSMHPRMPADDAVRTYLTLGGVPLYHVLSDQDSYEDVLWELFFRDLPELADEAEGMINTEFSSADRYIAVVTAIAGGATDLKTIAEKSAIEAPNCKKYLERLIGLGMVARVNPMFGAPKRPVYRIEDALMSFHYEVVSRRRARIDPYDRERTFAGIRNDLSTFLGKRFESMCREYLQRNHHCLEIGRWWGRVGSDDEGRTVIREADVAATIEQQGVVFDVLCESRFGRNPAGFDALNQLMGCADNADVSANTRYVIFSWNGFTDELLEHAETAPDLRLVDRDAILGNVPLDLMERRLRRVQSRSASIILSPTGQSRSPPSLVTVYFWPVTLPTAWHLQ